jgi:hypothetical protein
MKKVMCEAMKVKPKIKWRLHNVRDARTWGVYCRKPQEMSGIITGERQCVQSSARQRFPSPLELPSYHQEPLLPDTELFVLLGFGLSLVIFLLFVPSFLSFVTLYV